MIQHQKWQEDFHNGQKLRRTTVFGMEKINGKKITSSVYFNGDEFCIAACHSGKKQPFYGG